MVVELIVALGVPVWLFVEALLHLRSSRPPVVATRREPEPKRVAKRRLARA